MAGYDISVGIGVEGESQFQAALKECQNSVKQLDSALKANAAEYANNADALGDNAERAKLLAQSIELQKKMMQGLGQAVQYATNEYGEASAQTTKYVVAQNKARESVAKMEKELADMGREMEEVGRDSIKVGRQLENGIGDGADDTAKKLSQMMDDIRGELSSIGGSVGITATIDVIKSVGEVVESVTEQSQEFRRSMSLVDQAARDFGHDEEVVERHVGRITAITGEMKGAVEGMNNLIGAGFDANELANAANLMLAAAVKFPDTYKFESLSESLRKTIEEGKAIGQYSELLLALGVDVDAFNEAMEKAKSIESRQDLALSFGANRGLESTIAEYEEVNKQMIAANEATFNYQQSLAGLAGQMEPIGTAYKEMSTATINAVSELLENTSVDEWLTGVMNNITETIRLIGVLADEQKKQEFANEKKQERVEMVESGVAETEGEAVLRQMEKPEWYIEYYREKARKNGETAGTETVQSMVKEIEAGTPEVEGVTADMVKNMTATVKEKSTEFEQAARAMMVDVRDEIATEGQTAIDNMNVVTDGIQAGLDSLDASGAIEQVNSFYRAVSEGPGLKKGWNLGSGGSGQQESGNPALQISMYMSETKVAEAIVPAVNRTQGFMIDRIGTLNA